MGGRATTAFFFSGHTKTVLPNSPGTCTLCSYKKTRAHTGIASKAKKHANLTFLLARPSGLFGLGLNIGNMPNDEGIFRQTGQKMAFKYLNSPGK